MLLDLTEVLDTPGKVLEEELTPERKWFRMGGGSFKALRSEPLLLRAEGVEKGRAKLSGRARMAFEARCDRCLVPVKVPIELDFERELLSPDADSEADDAEQAVLDGSRLDIEALLESETTLAWPLKILCREDCKGLCPVCGANRNETECGCDTVAVDPRWAGLGDLVLDP